MLKTIGKIMLILGIAAIVAIVLVVGLDARVTKGVPIILSTSGMFLASLGSAFIFLNAEETLRKKAAYIGRVVSAFLIVLGLVCSYLHQPGARIELMVGIFILCFFHGTLSFKNKYEKWKVYTRSNRDAFFLSTFDFIGIGFLFLGALFKIQQWGWAEEMMFIGFGVTAIGTLAWNQKFKTEVVQRKEAEDKLKETLSEVENQKQKVEEKQKEIIDSIKYAKRIQQSLLPTEKYIEKNLKRLKKGG
jgi:hypothetical protein